MSIFSKYNRHAGLAGRMADALGVDIDEKLQRGELRPEDLRNTVQRCMGCDDPADCEHWLDANKDGADETPSYCRNKALFEELSKKD